MDARSRRRWHLGSVCTFGPALVAGAIAVGLRVHATSSAAEIAAVGFRAPDFDLPVLGDASRRVTLSGLRGRPMIVVFNCGCKACNDFDRALAAAAGQFKDTRVAAITMNPSAYGAGKLSEFRKRSGFQWPILVDDRMETTLQYNSAECPRVWLIDRGGVIRYHDPDCKGTPGGTVAELAQACRRL